MTPAEQELYDVQRREHERQMEETLADARLALEHPSSTPIDFDTRIVRDAVATQAHEDKARALERAAADERWAADLRYYERERAR